MFSGINPGHSVKNPCFMYLIHVNTTGIKAATCRYIISSTIDVDCWLLWNNSWVFSYSHISFPVLFVIWRRQIPFLVSLLNSRTF